MRLRHVEPRRQPRIRRRSVLGFAMLTLLAPRSAPAQAIGQGFELERAGQFEQAASIYLATLRADPTNLSALLGLERVLPGLNRLGELVPVAQRAAAASPANAALRAVLLRTYVGINEPDSAREVARRWAAAARRERIAALLAAGDPAPLVRRLAGELLLAWGAAERAWAVFAPSVATPSADAAYAVRRFADLAAAHDTPAARRVRALALARYAELVPDPVAVRARTDAARAFLAAGDREGARAVLDQVARESTAPADAQALA